MAGALYLIGTPIGNLGDLSPRAAETLASVDFIAAEDTRVSIKLLNHLGLKKPMLSYHEHNKKARGDEILARLQAGQSCALVTDAGMPAVSDPGEALVALCAEHGIEVLCVPGPTAFVAALALSGLPSGRATFEGFLSTVKKNRLAHLQSLQEERRTMIFYEAPHKLAQTLQDMHKAFGDRRLALSRELTKRYEETIRTTLSEAVQQYAEEKPRGEFVLVIEGAPEPVAAPDEAMHEQAIARVHALCASGLSRKDAARQVAGETGISKNFLYASGLR